MALTIFVGAGAGGSTCAGLVISGGVDGGVESAGGEELPEDGVAVWSAGASGLELPEGSVS